MHGKYGFSHDIIFNKTIRGSLKHSHSSIPPVPTGSPTQSSSPRPHHLQTLTERGHAWADTIRIQDERHQHIRSHGFFAPTLHPQQSMVAINDFLSYFALVDLPDSPIDLQSFKYPVLLQQSCLATYPHPLRLPKSFDLSKAPENYHEAVA